MPIPDTKLIQEELKQPEAKLIVKMLPKLQITKGNWREEKVCIGTCHMINKQNHFNKMSVS